MEDLEFFRKERGMTQGELARRLGISQPHLSRVITGNVPPGNRLALRIRELLKPELPSKRDDWLAQVSKTAKRLPSFKALVDAALTIARKR